MTRRTDVVLKQGWMLPVEVKEPTDQVIFEFSRLMKYVGAEKRVNAQAKKLMLLMLWLV